MASEHSSYVCVLLLLCGGVSLQAADPEYEAIVVGLGPAGLASLTRLTELGYKVLGLEAKDRIGGRVNTQEFGGGLVEFGAQWIHGEEGNPTYRLARDNNVTLLTSRWRQHFANNGGYNQTVVLELFKFCMESSEKKAGINETLGEYITKAFYGHVSSMPAVAEDKEFCKNFLRTMEHILARLDAYDSWHEESMRSAQEYEQCTGSQSWSWHWLGYRTLFDILLHKYNNGTPLVTDMRLEHEVTSIDWSQADRVVVTALDKRTGVTSVYEGKTAVVTVSLGVLKHRYATWFKPSLPKEKVDAINVLSIGVVDKISLHYEQPWWGDYNAQYFLWTDKELNALPNSDRWLSNVSHFAVPMSNSRVVTLWVTGEAARHMETLDLQVVRNKTEWLLRKFFGDLPRATDVRRSTWFSDEYVRGSYSYRGVATDAYPPGAPAAALAAPLPSATAPRLLFAGEASHQHHFSTVHGAIETGWREADRIHEKFPQEVGTTAYK